MGNGSQRRRILAAFVAAMMIVAAAGAAMAQGVTASGAKGLPRFAALRAAEVNLRTGPGTRYPIDWVYLQRHFPIQIIAEFDGWRKIRDWQGTTGWVHKSMLTGRRTVLVQGGIRQIHRDSGGGGPVIARVEPKVVGRLLRCREDWCRVEFKGVRGWLPRAALWGAGKAEKK